MRWPCAQRESDSDECSAPSASSLNIGPSGILPLARRRAGRGDRPSCNRPAAWCCGADLRTSPARRRTISAHSVRHPLWQPESGGGPRAAALHKRTVDFLPHLRSRRRAGRHPSSMPTHGLPPRLAPDRHPTRVVVAGQGRVRSRSLRQLPSERRRPPGDDRWGKPFLSRSLREEVARHRVAKFPEGRHRPRNRQRHILVDGSKRPNAAPILRSLSATPRSGALIRTRRPPCRPAHDVGAASA